MGRARIAVMVLVAACSGMPTIDGGQPDGGSPLDAGNTVHDAGTDAGVTRDAGPMADAGVDAGTDGGSDAGTDGGFDAGIDTVPPVFTISTTTPQRVDNATLMSTWNPLGEWKHDEDPIVEVQWNAGDVDVDTVLIEVSPAFDGGTLAVDAGITVVANSACGCSSGCRCFQVDGRSISAWNGLWFADAWVDFTATASGRDFSGNSAAPVSTSRETTRFLWVEGRSRPAVGLALDPRGNIYSVGTGGIDSLSPLGISRWTHAASISATPPLFLNAPDGGLVYFAQAGSSSDAGAIVGLSAADGTEAARCLLPATTQSNTPLVLALSASHQIIAIATSDGAQQTLTALAVDLAGAHATCDSTPVSFSASATVAPVAFGTTVCFAGTDLAVHCTELRDDGRWQVGATDTVAAVLPASMPNTAIGSLAVIPYEGTLRVIGTTSGSYPTIFLLSGDRSSADIVGTFVENLGFDAVPVLSIANAADGGLWLYTAPGPTFDRYHLGSDAGVEQFSGETDPLTTAAPIASDGRVYVRASDLTAVVSNDSFASRGATGEVPDIIFFTEVAGPAPVALDCNRRTGRGGVMYQVNNYGGVDAYLIDSPGIDVNSPWPAYQHDPANTGQASPEILRAYACPP